TQQMLQCLADACRVQPSAANDFVAGNGRLRINRQQDALEPRSRNSGHSAYYVITSQKCSASLPKKIFFMRKSLLRAPQLTSFVALAQLSLRCEFTLKNALACDIPR